MMEVEVEVEGDYWDVVSSPGWGGVGVGHIGLGSHHTLPCSAPVSDQAWEETLTLSLSLAGLQPTQLF